jgi:threonine aldolase
MERAWRIRRRLGGAMRQSGILAAAGLYALEHNRSRLAEDHRRAKMLAQGAGRIDGLRVQPTETNIVMLDVQAPGVTAEVILAFLAERGVLMVPFGPKRIRAVTHMDVGDEGVSVALGALALAMRALARA